MAREYNEHAEKFLERQINLTNCTTCSGFANVLRITDSVQKCATRKKVQPYAYSLSDSKCTAAAGGIGDVWLEKVL